MQCRQTTMKQELSDAINWQVVCTLDYRKHQALAI
jgi:hypothetical protein